MYCVTADGLKQARACGVVSVTSMTLLLALLNARDARADLTLSEVARLLEVTTAAVTGIVDRLEALRLVERGWESSDRRVITVALTVRGREMLLGCCDVLMPARGGMAAVDAVATLPEGLSA